MTQSAIAQEVAVASYDAPRADTFNERVSPPPLLACDGDGIPNACSNGLPESPMLARERRTGGGGEGGGEGGSAASGLLDVAPPVSAPTPSSSLARCCDDDRLGWRGILEQRDRL